MGKRGVVFEVSEGTKLQWLSQILLGPSEDCDLYPNKLGVGEGHDLMGFNRMLLAAVSRTDSLLESLRDIAGGCNIHEMMPAGPWQ